MLWFLSDEKNFDQHQTVHRKKRQVVLWGLHRDTHDDTNLIVGDSSDVVGSEKLDR